MIDEIISNKLVEFFNDARNHTLEEAASVVEAMEERVQQDGRWVLRARDEAVRLDRFMRRRFAA